MHPRAEIITSIAAARYLFAKRNPKETFSQAKTKLDEFLLSYKTVENKFNSSNSHREDQGTSENDGKSKMKLLLSICKMLTGGACIAGNLYRATVTLDTSVPPTKIKMGPVVA